MKKLLTLLLALSLCLTLAVPVFATETEDVVEIDYNCGEDMTWTFSDGTLTITGNGSMDDFEESAPWEIHKDAINENDVVLLHDDLLATGGTMAATYRLVQKCGAKQAYINFVIELEELNGRKAFPETVEVETLLKL